MTMPTTEVCRQSVPLDGVLVLLVLLVADLRVWIVSAAAVVVRRCSVVGWCVAAMWLVVGFCRRNR